MSSVTFAAQANQPDPNSGFVTRQKIIRGSRPFTLVGRPHIDLFHQNLDIPPCCPITIKFTPAKSTFAFVGAVAHIGVKVMMLGAKLYVRSKKVAPRADHCTQGDAPEVQYAFSAQPCDGDTIWNSARLHVVRSDT